jgi:hypothetical protein
VCSISTNSTVDEQLKELQRSNDRKMIEKRLFEMADYANVGRAGLLDETSTKVKDMPPELKDARKIRIGRHRIFYTGEHKKCTFSTFYIKIHKKKGVKDENDKSFQDILKKTLKEPVTGEIKR